jgi:tetratricopeptide (TPR) repeat protein
LRRYRSNADPEVITARIYPKSKLGFYSQAWALSHYMMFGPSDLLYQLDDYLERWRNGEAAEEAFEFSFGISYDEFWKRVMSHIRAREFVYGRFPFDENEISVNQRTLSDAEVRSALGDLLLQGRRRLSDAAELLHAAVAADPTLAQPHASLSALMEMMGRYSEAEPVLQTCSLESICKKVSRNKLAPR